MLNGVEHEKSFLTSGPDHRVSTELNYSLVIMTLNLGQASTLDIFCLFHCPTQGNGDILS